VATFFRATACAVFSLLAAVVCLSARVGAAPQQPASAAPVSLERIRHKVVATPALRVDVKPLATFKTSVDQRLFMLPFKEQLHKEFDLTPLQRQSQEWRSKCCGINLLNLPKTLDRALQRREERKAREQVARELAEVQAAAKK
jgi:hypothetical protein